MAEFTEDMSKDERKAVQRANTNARIRYFSKLKKLFIGMFEDYQNSELYLECVRKNSGENAATSNKPPTAPTATPKQKEAA